MKSGPDSSAPALAVAGIAALLASTCCVLPLALAIAGISGAWIVLLHGMAPYSAALTGLALAALALAGWRIYRPNPQRASCDPGSACSSASGGTRRWFWALAALTLLPLLAPLVAPFFY